MDNLFRVSQSPHLYDRDTVQKIMLMVILAMVPALAGAYYFFGFRALWVVVITVSSCLITEALLQKLMKKPVTISDLSAVVTGILLAYNLPPAIPMWMPVLGGIFSIAIAKQAFGGLGFNPVNPALAARAFMLASWPVQMTVFKTVPKGGTLSGTTIDLFSGATPLNALKQSIDIVKHADEFTAVEKMIGASQTIQGLKATYADLFFGRVGGCLGETSAFLLLIGGAFLLYRRIIGWRIPFFYVTTVAILMWVFGGTTGLFSGDPVFHVLSGGLILGAFFMATDMVTSPITPKGHIYFALGCGVITVVIRLVGGYPEGVSYSILLMNLTVPLLNRFIKPEILGERKKK